VENESMLGIVSRPFEVGGIPFGDQATVGSGVSVHTPSLEEYLTGKDESRCSKREIQGECGFRHPGSLKFKRRGLRDHGDKLTRYHYDKAAKPAKLVKSKGVEKGGFPTVVGFDIQYILKSSMQYCLHM
jgi:hypothetical protein